MPLTRGVMARPPTEAASSRIWALAENLQGLLAQPIRIALAGPGKLDDAFGEHGICSVAPCSENCCAGHLECDAHDALGLGVVSLVAKEGRDWHVPAPGTRTAYLPRICRAPSHSFFGSRSPFFASWMMSFATVIVMGSLRSASRSLLNAASNAAAKGATSSGPNTGPYSV